MDSQLQLGVVAASATIAADFARRLQQRLAALAVRGVQVQTGAPDSGPGDPNLTLLIDDGSAAIDGVRAALIARQQAFSVLHVADAGAAPLDAALDALAPLLGRSAPGLFSRLLARTLAEPRWQWTCDSCDVPECEHALQRREG